MMAFYLKLYLVTLVAFFLVDMVWLGLVARKFYSAQIWLPDGAQTQLAGSDHFLPAVHPGDPGVSWSCPA